MALTPLWLALDKEYTNPTEFSKASLDYYEGSVQFGEGFTDIAMARKGIDADDTLSYYTWKALENQFDLDPDRERTTREIMFIIDRLFSIDQIGRKLEFERTTLNHTLNRFMFLGVIYKIKKSTHDIFVFELQIRRTSMNWFREGNIYMPGKFQWQKGLGLI